MHTRSLLAFVYRVDETHHDRRDCLPGQIPAAHRYDQPLLSRGARIAGRMRLGLGNAGASLFRIVHLRRCPTSVTGDASSAVSSGGSPYRARISCSPNVRPAAQSASASASDSRSPGSDNHKAV
ncbi:MAG: hypothetical protein QOI29_719 [Mycobacterium sp.]|nr:hypothetical protein [Mycobacterium sp.]